MVLTNIKIFTNDQERRMISDGAVAFDCGVFTYVGERHFLKVSDDEQVLDGRGGLLMPALVNAHMSLHSTVTAHVLAVAEDSPLGTAYYEKIIRSLSDGSHARLSLLSTIAGVVRSLRYGVTTIFGPVLHSDDLSPDLYRELACRTGVNLSVGPIVNSRNVETVIDVWKDAPKDPLFCPQFYVADSALYTNQQIALLGQLASNGFFLSFLIFDMHEESDECLSIWGETLAERFVKNNLFNNNSVVAYAGSLSETDMDLLSSRGVSVSKSIRSELYGGIFFPAIGDLLGRGMQVNVGSGFIDEDIFAEMKTKVLMDRQYKHYDNRMIDYEVRKTLLNGNFRLADRCFRKKSGVIKEGYSADMVLTRPFMDIDGFDEMLPTALQIILRLPSEVVFDKAWNNGRLVFSDSKPAGISSEDIRSLLACLE